MNSFWESERAPARITIEGIEITKGSRVRLHPRPGGDIMDMALAGRVAYVESIEQDYENKLYVAVTIEDDPGRDLGDAKQPGHRFFFSVEEVAPLEDETDGPDSLLSTAAGKPARDTEGGEGR